MYGNSSCKSRIFVFNIYIYCLIRENTYLIISVLKSYFYSNYCVIFVIIYFIILFRYVKVLFFKKKLM